MERERHLPRGSPTRPVFAFEHTGRNGDNLQVRCAIVNRTPVPDIRLRAVGIVVAQADCARLFIHAYLRGAAVALGLVREHRAANR